MINKKASDLVMIEGEAFTVVEVLSSSTGNVYKCKSLVDNCYGFYEDIEFDEENKYEHEITVEGNVAVVRLYEYSANGTKREIAKGHGHIIHDGAVGYAQAIGFAFNRIVKALGGYPSTPTSGKTWGKK